jgi:hypothetical protein
MARLKFLLAFALGWSFVAVLQFGANAAAKSGGAPAAQDQPGLVAQRIVFIDHIVSQLEKASDAGTFKRQVTAPFEVVDRAGQRLFYVTPEREVEFYRGEKRAAVMSAATEIGTLWALGGTQKSAALTGTELTMKEGNHLRVALGKEAGHGNYRLQFASSAAENLAAIGVSWQTQGGAALVFDGAGNLKADMTAAGDYRGNVAVMSGENKPVAILTQSGDGYLVLGGASSCLPPMVEVTGVNDYGIVGTGPSGWAPGAGFVIAAGSVISGKH